MVVLPELLQRGTFTTQGFWTEWGALFKTLKVAENLRRFSVILRNVILFQINLKFVNMQYHSTSPDVFCELLVSGVFCI